MSWTSFKCPVSKSNEFNSSSVAILYNIDAMAQLFLTPPIPQRQTRSHPTTAHNSSSSHSCSPHPIRIQSRDAAERVLYQPLGHLIQRSWRSASRTVSARVPRGDPLGAPASSVTIARTDSIAFDAASKLNLTSQEAHVAPAEPSIEICFCVPD